MRRCCRVSVPPEPLQHAGRRVAFRFSITVGFDLPDWFRNPKDVGPSSCLDAGEENDDFVLPATIRSDFSDERSSGKAFEGSKPLSICARYPAATSHADADAEFEADVDEISRVLSSRFTSPEAIVIALDCCSVRVSGRLVDKILRKFGNDWVAAFMWAGTQEGYCHFADSYDLMVDILGKFKQFDLMFGLISQMHEVGGMVSLTTMTKVMRRLCGASRWSDAIDVFHKMDRFGVAKDTKAMNVLLDALCKEMSVKRARGAFQELMGTIPPDEGSFNTLVHGWCKARRLGRQWQKWSSMVSVLQ
jgi:pentatricopeptide repeat protein